MNLLTQMIELTGVQKKEMMNELTSIFGLEELSKIHTLEDLQALAHKYLEYINEELQQKSEDSEVLAH